MRRNLLIPLIAIVVIAIGALTLTFVVGNAPQLGLDLQGGASVVLQPKEQVPDETLDQTIQIIRNRVDALGVAEPEITRQGSNIVVQLPGVKDQEKALQIVGQTAELHFRPVLEDLTFADAIPPTTSVPASSSTTTPGASTTTPGASTTTPGASTTTPAAPSTTAATSTSGLGRSLARQATSTTTATTAAPTATTVADPTATTVADPTATTVVAPSTSVPATSVPTTPRDQDDPTKESVLELVNAKGQVQGRLRVGPSQLGGEAVETAEARFADTQGWAVQLTMKPGKVGIDGFNQIASQCFSGAPTCPAGAGGRGRLAVVLDAQVRSAPTINEASFTRDQIQISGNFTESEAKDLALVLRYGSLPVQLEPQAVQTVSATLGQDSLRAGIAAGLVGLALVIVFMFFYYRSLAIVVLLGLGVSGALLWSIISWLGASRGLALTLAGATGIIVSIGVTVDSYVVYFERLKDDVRLGRTLRSSVDRGFSSAYRTILAADLVSLIGATLLWYFSVGSVRGFAFFLGLSTFLDLIVSYFFTRPLVGLLARSPRFAKGRVLGVQQGEATSRPVPVGAPA